MASLIPGYNYDIFISYRQKDNRHEGWVSGFVDNLRNELESTFKEEISVYFDINPHDGLLETHDVDASLKEKLKCLIFIPIISRTYCDPKSFAWENEFKAFIEQASQDQFGLQVKLQDGNIANRVLPVRIHDLDASDIKLCESYLGGTLAGVEFIYKSPGINRPLRLKEDNPGDNLNKTFYRDQVNKVALAIKEIILRLKSASALAADGKVLPPGEPEEIRMEDREIKVAKHPGISRDKLKLFLLIIAILLAAVVIFYPKVFKGNRQVNPASPGNRISVAVIPFQNMTNDTSWNVWQVGIQDNLAACLSNYSDIIEVRQTVLINNYIKSKGISGSSISPSVAGTISDKLNAAVFIFGSIKKAGNILRINAQLFDSKTEEALKSFQVEATARQEILPVIDSLSFLVRDFLLISGLEKEMNKELRPFISTRSAVAYRYSLYGFHSYFDIRDYSAARNWFLQAAGVDSNYVVAFAMISYTYGDQEIYDEAKKWCIKAYGKRNLATFQQKPYIDLNYASFFETPREQIKYELQLLDFNDQVPYFHYRLGLSYCELLQYEEAITAFEKSLAIYDGWKSKPGWIQYYTYLGKAYHMTGQFRKEKNLYKKAEQYFPDDPLLAGRKIILALAEGDTVSANLFIEKYTSLRKNNAEPESEIITGLADIYSEANIQDAAENNYRRALRLEPDNAVRKFNLAAFLINTDHNINEGLELVNEALGTDPENYKFLNCKGWGLHKLGSNDEALALLEKSRYLQPVYSYDLSLRLDEVRKAIASQKNN